MTYNITSLGWGENRYECNDCGEIRWFETDMIAHMSEWHTDNRKPPAVEVNTELERSIELGKRFELVRKQMDELSRDMDAIAARVNTHTVVASAESRYDTIRKVLAILNESSEYSAAETVRDMLKGS